MVAASGTREHLLAAGARSAREVVVTPAGDEMTFLRDPWGVTLQLVRRATPLLAMRTNPSRTAATGVCSGGFFRR